jgi:flagellar motor component MotA
MINQPTEKYQVNMILKNLLSVYYNHLFSSPVMKLKQLNDYELKLEDTINSGLLDRNEGKPQQKMTSKGTNVSVKSFNPASVSTVTP